MDAIQARLATKAAWLANLARLRAGQPQETVIAPDSDAIPDDASYTATVAQLDADIAQLQSQIAQALAATGVSTAPIVTLADAITAQCAAVDAIFAKKTITKGGECVCPTPSGVVQCDNDSRLNIAGACLMAVLAAQTATPFSIAWTMADNTVTTLYGPHMIGMGQAVGAYVSQCHARASALKAQIRAITTTPADVQAIDISVGWP